ncbi:hypothetical protein GV794_01935 [Nocardia cyriacigeorgica]|uniref:Single-stranded DNA-binding protein n=1 Tax=Nocardia cyriacigeorgica TaxID=135487 RepID=A0ABX0CJA8_9NOCA|nr:hypothetical protein [Nocardia cyriacigeorgica]NEW40783.1 hypothetical protein [Nocardia cyriacigeorgica]NEW50991.1 hypothetical protein [Nocardia cyriacigeorgica]NEW54426.1 hypothetical protein [Nocardia cyriacigeorgica]
MKRLPERWTLLRPGLPVIDPSTGNRMPGPVQEVPWWGLLQQKSLIDENVISEIEPGRVFSRLTLLLMPGVPGGTSRRDVWRFDGPSDVSDLVGVGDTVTVQGTPRVRRPAIGSRRPAYIAAVVRHASDMQEVTP